MGMLRSFSATFFSTDSYMYIHIREFMHNSDFFYSRPKDNATADLDHHLPSAGSVEKTGIHK